MVIKKINLKDYKKIQNFIEKNNSNLPSLKSLKLLDKISKKKSCYNIDGLYFKDKLVGYHSAIEKVIIFKKKKFKILISSNWNVSEKFRNYSIPLINKYFKTNSDFYCTTTANEKGARIWKFLGCIEINNFSNRFTFFKVTNYLKLLNYYLKKKNIKIIPNSFILMASKIFEFIFFKKNSLIKNNIFTYKKITKKSLDLEKFNRTYETSSQYPLEQRSNFILSRYIKILESNNKSVFIYQIILKNKMVGYVVLVGETHNGLKRLFLGDLKIIDKYKSNIHHIISFSTNIAKINDFPLIYFRNLKPNIFKYINFKNFFVTKHAHNPYLIKIGTNKAKKLEKFFKNKWGTTYFDGDCLL